ncbi:MAG TPA: imidazolonepropionase [Myxococcota bacterium]|nr:imidazolonepropionase [Myxococcota bacterium]
MGLVVVKNIGLLLTMSNRLAIADAVVVIKDGVIEWVGPGAEFDSSLYQDCTVIDADGGLVTPGLVECHTHLVFAGDRSDEFEARATGVPYAEIARRGGGIAKTVKATREASEDQLFELAVPRVYSFLAQGVTTVEAKSGYGLDFDSEMRLLNVAARLDKATPVDIVSTFLGAHSIPAEAKENRAAFVDDICDRWIPEVAQRQLAVFCDVFCESIAFSVDESRRILKAGLLAGLKPKIHAEQLARTGGALLAAELGAVSADHLDFASKQDAKALAEAGTVGVLLPGCAVSMCKPDFPDPKLLQAAGGKIALSTDYNPGSSVTLNLPLMGSFAMAFMGMSAMEVWEAITINAAAALDLQDFVGMVKPGYKGDLVIFRGADPVGPFYEYGGSKVAKVIKEGSVVVRRDPCGGVTI